MGEIIPLLREETNHLTQQMVDQFKKLVDAAKQGHTGDIVPRGTPPVPAK